MERLTTQLLHLLSLLVAPDHCDVFGFSTLIFLSPDSFMSNIKSLESV